MIRANGFLSLIINKWSGTRETDGSLNVAPVMRNREMFLFPCALNIRMSVPPADDSWNVSVIALDVVENEAFGSVGSSLVSAVRHRIQRAVK